jgi:hypothetical protein
MNKEPAQEINPEPVLLVILKLTYSSIRVPESTLMT